MKFYDLIIYTDDTERTFDGITAILNVTPLKAEDSKFGSKFGVWTYRLSSQDEEAEPDYIDHFISILKPRFHELEKIGVFRDRILVWLLYEYQHQCALGFSPEDLKKLGENGIALNIDCWTHEESTNA